MPHGWVASDQIRSVLDLFAYEHEGERSLVADRGLDVIGITPDVPLFAPPVSARPRSATLFGVDQPLRRRPAPIAAMARVSN